MRRAELTLEPAMRYNAIRELVKTNVKAGYSCTSLAVFLEFIH